MFYFLQDWGQNILFVRALGCGVTALGWVLVLGPVVIRQLRLWQPIQSVRAFVPKGHLNKTGTPSFGGLLIIGAIVVSTLLWGYWGECRTWMVLGALVGFGIIGFCDDYLKATRKHGLTIRCKYGWQSLLALSVAVCLYKTATVPAETQVWLPFSQVGWDLGWLLIPWVYFVVVGSSNAVNLTDGLDGLAILPVALCCVGLSVFAMASSLPTQSPVPFLPGSEELIIVCAAIVGASLGFLWFNTHPAQIFMGDVGSLGLGAALGALASVLRQEWTLFIMGGVFVLETISVILQVLSFKLTGRRLFLITPFHHHLELKGWLESRIVVRFWVVTGVLVVLGLMPLLY